MQQLLSKSPRALVPLMVVFILSSCTFFEENIESPSLLNIRSVSASVISGQGGETSRISDVWMFANGQDIGVYEVPKVIPILPNSETTFLSIFAGIRRNGQNDNPVIYPFYKNIDIERNLLPEATEDLDLVFDYRPNTVFALLEDFESQHTFTNDADQNPETVLNITSASASSGSFSGHIQVTSDNPLTEIASGTPVPLPTDGNAVYLEIDIKSDIETVIGLIGVDDAGEYTSFFIVIIPQPEWKKFYISLEDLLSQSGLELYRLVIGASIEDQNIDQGNIFVDNIKILHF